jgi:hypothetical protein
MSGESWKTVLARRLLKNTAPEEMMGIVDLFLPSMVGALSKTQLKAFLRLLFEKYLGFLLRGMRREERAQLLSDLLPVIAREFPLQDIDIENAVRMSQTHYP